MEPTCTDMLIATTAEAHIVMYAVAQNLRPMIRRRPGNEDERSQIRPGAVFVWEEGSGIERWTDRREWGDSRSREDFLFYTEGPKASQRSFNEPYSAGSSQWSSRPGQDPLVKQTYTATIQRPEGERKWHLIAYFTEGTKDSLRRVADDRVLRTLVVPAGTFRQARLPKSRRMRERAWSTADGPAPQPAPPTASTPPAGRGPPPPPPDSPPSPTWSGSSSEPAWLPYTRQHPHARAAAAALCAARAVEDRWLRMVCAPPLDENNCLAPLELPKELPQRRHPFDELALQRLPAFECV